MTSYYECNEELNHKVTLEDVNRVIEVGQLLLSVLTEEELKELNQLLGQTPIKVLIGKSSKAYIGNSGIS